MLSSKSEPQEADSSPPSEAVKRLENPGRELVWKERGGTDRLFCLLPLTRLLSQHVLFLPLRGPNGYQSLSPTTNQFHQITFLLASDCSPSL